MYKIPAFYHPTTLTLVDDDNDFLMGLALALADHFRCHTFTSPDACEQFFRMMQFNPTLTDCSYISITDESWSDLQIDIQINSIYNEVFNHERFATCCVVIVDYDMPDRNGLDLARALKKILPIKVILLTGEADRETAIQAFNAKEIDRFISKGSQCYHQQLLGYVQELQLDYFIEQSIAILKSLDSQEIRPLQHRNFIRLFQAVCAKYHCVEYYLLDESGSFLLLDASGNETWLILRSTLDMLTYCELAQEEPLPSKEILTALQNRSKLVFFKQGSEGIPPVQEWLFTEAKQLANTKAYYGLLHGKQGYAQPEPIFSYTEFLNS